MLEDPDYWESSPRSVPQQVTLFQPQTLPTCSTKSSVAISQLTE